MRNTRATRQSRAVGLGWCCRPFRRQLERALVVRHDFFAVPSELSLAFNLEAAGYKRAVGELARGRVLKK